VAFHVELAVNDLPSHVAPCEDHTRFQNRAWWAKVKTPVGFNPYLNSKSLVSRLVPLLDIIIRFQLRSDMAGLSSLTSLLPIEVWEATSLTGRKKDQPCHL
jgi:hypothetical protein